MLVGLRFPINYKTDHFDKTGSGQTKRTPKHSATGGLTAPMKNDCPSCITVTYAVKCVSSMLRLLVRCFDSARRLQRNAAAASIVTLATPTQHAAAVPSDARAAARAGRGRLRGRRMTSIAAAVS